MSFKRMFHVIGTVHSLYGSSRVRVFFDMIWCAFRYGVGYLDYMVFGFAKITGRTKRETFMTMNHNLSLVRRKNNPECYEIFNDKILFNETFGDYIGRKWIDLRKSDAQQLEAFCKAKTRMFAKQTHTFGGQGIECVHLDETTDYQALYSHLTEQKQYLVEEAIVQHDALSRLCPNSVNTVRMVTILKEGEPVFVYSLLRIGNGKNDVDNITSGGLYAPLNDEGTVTKPGFCDKALKYYDNHPVTGEKIVGFQVPYFSQSVELCKKAALVEPRMGYVGWDVAITPDGPILVEGNNFPSYDMVQNYGHIDGGIGIKPKFERLIGMKL